jgi:hypothetical protein
MKKQEDESDRTEFVLVVFDGCTQMQSHLHH